MYKNKVSREVLSKEIAVSKKVHNKTTLTTSTITTTKTMAMDNLNNTVKITAEVIDDEPNYLVLLYIRMFKTIIFASIFKSK